MTCATPTCTGYTGDAAIASDGAVVGSTRVAIAPEVDTVRELRAYCLSKAGPELELAARSKRKWPLSEVC